MKRFCRLNCGIAAGAALSLIVVLALSGCGGGGSSDPSGAGSTGDPPTISKAQLIKQGDAICAKTDKAQEAAMNAYGKEHPDFMESKAAFVKMVKKAALPLVRTEIKELKALGAPSGEEEKVATIIGGFEKAQKEAEADPSFAMGLTEGPFTAPAKLAAQFGFKACAEPL